MTDTFGRATGAYKNALSQSVGALVGIAQGLLADKKLTDDEINFLKTWLESNSTITTAFPGNIITERVRAVLADGIITEEERTHLLKTLEAIVGGTIEQMNAATTRVIQLGFDDAAVVAFPGALFCLTGEFVFGPKAACEALISARGGLVSKTVSKKVRYVVAGGLGSAEWKHGSFGAKIERAMELQRGGTNICLLREERLVSAASAQRNLPT